jgi:hypothetical protein
VARASIGVGRCRQRKAVELGEVSGHDRELGGQAESLGPGHDCVGKEGLVPIEVAGLDEGACSSAVGPNQ